jgi:hypothetical protein
VKSKDIPLNDLHMKASEFDKMMRHALQAPPVRKAKAGAKKRKAGAAK